MTDHTGDDPEEWVGRRHPRAGWPRRVTNGAAAGTSGARFSWRTWLAVFGLIVLAGFVNVMTVLDDAHRHGVPASLTVELALEATSAVAALTTATLIGLAVRLAPPGRGPILRTVVVHLGGSLAYSAAHVTLMTSLRVLLWGAVGLRYPWAALGDFPYEYRKDALAYVVIAGIFWITARPATAPSPQSAEAAPTTFDIRDAATILRVPVGEIIAPMAARNYVEFVLEDGRRPLMRASIAQIEAKLGPAGFVRTHRSWLVNAGRVRALSAAGSGDFRVDLGCGLTAPLSRRYPAALARLRGEG